MWPFPFSRNSLGNIAKEEKKVISPFICSLDHHPFTCEIFWLRSLIWASRPRIILDSKWYLSSCWERSNKASTYNSGHQETVTQIAKKNTRGTNKEKKLEQSKVITLGHYATDNSIDPEASSNVLVGRAIGHISMSISESFSEELESERNFNMFNCRECFWSPSLVKLEPKPFGCHHPCLLCFFPCSPLLKSAPPDMKNNRKVSILCPEVPSNRHTNIHM